MTENNAAQAAEQDLQYVVRQLRQTGRVVDEEGELTDRLDALLSKLRAPVADERVQSTEWGPMIAGTEADESPMAKIAEALREKARQEQQAYQDRRAQSVGAKPVAHVAGDGVSRFLEWAKDRSAWEMPVGTPLFYGEALASAPICLTDAERSVITGLIAVARAAFNLADDAEDDGDRIKVGRADANALGETLEILEELPDDQPGYAMGPSNKAEWALRRLLGNASAPVAGEAQTGNLHTLKTDPEVFKAVMVGAKTFEIRLNDRTYQIGDTLRLRETRFTGEQMREGKPLEYTGRECQRVVSHVLTGYGLAENWCCLSFAAPQASEAVDVEAAAMKMAECMDYPWAEMPEQGRAHMRTFAQSVVNAALSAQPGAQKDDNP